MKQWTHEISVRTCGKGLHECTAEIENWVESCAVGEGLLTIFIRHTSASLTVQENADPDVIADLADFFERIAPEDLKRYRHNSEGPDDMPAHIRSALTQSQLSIPVIRGRLSLGTWQGIYVFEHRAHGHRRQLALHLLGNE